MPDAGCRVYWGSHGCHLPRGHEGHHWCCCDCPDHEGNNGMRIMTPPAWTPGDDPDWLGMEYRCVGAYPFYGPDTKFYGEDAPTEARNA